MPSILNVIADWWPLLLFLAPLLISSLSTHSFDKEVERNEKFATPEERQVFWHVVHNRQDIKTIYFVTYFGFAIVIALLLRIAQKLNALS